MSSSLVWGERTSPGEALVTHYVVQLANHLYFSPVVEINLMGYADPNQVGSGLRQRLYCRAFIIGSLKNPDDRFVYLVLDTQSGDTAVRHGILEGLSLLGKEYSIYGSKNVAVTGTHSHSGPGAWLNYLLPQITSKGFNKQSYRALVDGSILAIQRAHESLAQGSLEFGSIRVDDANINRSPFAYLANPEEERSRYEHDVDKTMTMLRFQRTADNKTMGVLTWFPVHGTSMLGNNTLISGDNKGVAARLLEEATKSDPNSSEDFVAGFSQSNVGDTSPNVLGAYCEDGSGEKCNFKDSTCGNRTQPCHGRGPFFREKDQGAKSCFEIGRRQYLSAKKLLSDPGTFTPITGSTVSSLHTFQDFTNFTFLDLTFDPKNDTPISTCAAALGHSFAAGTTDGPGAFDFRQNCTGDCPSNSNPLWKVAGAFVHPPTEEQVKCQAPKPILLDVGPAKKPYPWTPNIVDIQLLRVGQLLIIISPGEATTMSGRRWKEAIASAAPSVLSLSDPLVVLGGPANSYTHYIATKEEYGVQRYEGASTLYGPNTLSAYINLTLTYLPYLDASASSMPPLPPGPKPPINVNRSLSFITPVAFDRPPLFKSFGDSLADPKPPSSGYVYRPRDTASTRFVGANPRNNLRLERTFAAIEKKQSNGSWRTVRDDADWSLIYHWKRTSTILATSEVEIEWEVEDYVEEGLYRMRYFGNSKGVNGLIDAFEGTGGAFLIGRSLSP
jgi:neutral ceramidase